jgi:hypothetical protein
VGDEEKHDVTYSFDFWGMEKVSIDDVPVISRLNLLSINLIRDCTFTVGCSEPHDVVIRRQRPIFFGGGRRKTYRIFIDGVPVDEFRGW